MYKIKKMVTLVKSQWQEKLWEDVHGTQKYGRPSEWDDDLAKPFLIPQSFFAACQRLKYTHVPGFPSMSIWSQLADSFSFAADAHQALIDD